MKKFRYKARDKAGKLVTGVVEAHTESAAAKLLRDKGYVVTGLSISGTSIKTLLKIKSKGSTSDLVAFTRQLATMVNAGLPLTESLSILQLQAKPSVQTVLSQVLADVEGGQSFSKALEKHPNFFPLTYVALVKSGETGGVLEKVLARLADNLEKQQEFKGKVRGALIYPVIIVIGMVGVSIIMIVFVIPRLTDLYGQFGKELPFTTRILTTISDLFIRFWYLVAVAAGVFAWFFNLWRVTPQGKLKLSQWVLKIPILGDLKRQIMLTELTRTLSLMVAAGVPILEALSVTTEIMPNAVVSSALSDVGKQIEKGFPISYSFAKHPEAFPYLLSQMIAVGEETGKMDEVLSKVSHVFEVESEQKVKALTSAIEPIIMILLGLGVAFLIVAVVLPIYQLTTAL